MRYSVLDDSGKPLDAHFELDRSAIVFHARGGAKGKDAKNSQCEVALRLLIERLLASDLQLDGVFVDSSRVKDMPLEQRKILAGDEAALSPDKVFGLLSSRMKQTGQSAGAAGGNSTKRIRIQLAGIQVADDLIEKLGAAPERLPVAQLEKVTAEDLLAAVDQLLDGAKHRFGPSTDFDVLLDTGQRLPPKAIFGLAATRALGFAVHPGHFTAGIGSPCFKALESGGFSIVPKDGATPTVPTNAVDPEWVEGTPKLRTHMSKERGSGLAAAKRAEFRRKHGRLFCELCEMDPVKDYGGSSGEACIEVHHAAVQVQHMDPTHRTKLSDLQCVCASCHRVAHRRLRDVIGD